MHNSAKNWQTAEGSFSEINQHLWDAYSLTVESEPQPYEVSDSLLPYRYFLESSLSSLLQQPITLLSSVDAEGDEWFWADLPVKEEMVRVGFPRSRIGVHLPAAILLSLMVGVQVMLVTSVLLARRLTSPLENLSQAARYLGSGNWPDPIPEEGPEELSELAKSFNRMVTEVRELMANRTTLLAGISHDLRTPLTQIQLALTMLPDDGGSPELMAGIQRDMDHINQLIGQFLEISCSLEKGREERVLLEKVIGDVVRQFRQMDANVEWSPCDGCQFRIDGLALQRVIVNLVENAIRYGEGSTVEIICHCEREGIVVQVLDRGPGISVDEKESVFQPFYRLEQSRGRATGGSGLGLAVVRQLCQANGWQVRLEQRPGGGTAAIVTLGKV